MFKKLLQSRYLNLFSVMIILLPIGISMIFGLQALAEEIPDNEQTELYNDSDGNGTISYEITADNKINWTINYTTTASTEQRFVGFNLLDRQGNSIQPTLAEGMTDNFSYQLLTDGQQTGELLQTATSTIETKDAVLKFTTDFVSDVQVVSALYQTDTQGGQTNIRESATPITLHIEAATSATESSEETSGENQSSELTTSDSSTTSTTSESNMDSTDEATESSTAISETDSSNELSLGDAGAIDMGSLMGEQLVTTADARSNLRVYTSDGLAGGIDNDDSDSFATGSSSQSTKIIPLATTVPNGSLYNNPNEFTSKLRSVYMGRNGTNPSNGISIIFGSSKLTNQTVQVFYDNAGSFIGSETYVDASGATQTRQVTHRLGIMLTLSNIQTKGSQPRIQVSNNFYSGIEYYNISQMSVTFSFYDMNDTANNGSFISLADITAANSSSLAAAIKQVLPQQMAISDSSSAAYMTFASMNHATGQLEYVAAGNGAQGIVSDAAGVGTNMNYYANGIVPEGKTSFNTGVKGVYAATINAAFTDYLGGETAAKNAVSFELNKVGSSTSGYSFILGSEYGEAWSTFSTSAISSQQSVIQSAPTKTVESLTSYTYDSATKTYSENSQTAKNASHYNDLDRAWDAAYGTNDWVAGHFPTSEAADAGIVPQAERYLNQGDSFYYYINQKMIDLTGQSFITPTGISLSDTWPAEVALPSSEDIIVYDLHGAVLASKYYSVSLPTENNNRQLTITFTTAGVALLNAQSGAKGTGSDDANPIYGGEVSVQIRAHLTSDAPSLTPITNTATSAFTFASGTTSTLSSNQVEIQTKGAFNLALTKVNQAGNPLAGATFAIYQGTTDATDPLITASSNEQGSLIFSGGLLEMGQSYTLKEIEAPTGFALESATWKLEITADGALLTNNLTGETKTLSNFSASDDQGVITISAGENEDDTLTNQLKVYQLNLTKVDANQETSSLGGADFELGTAVDSQGIVSNILATATSSESDGSLAFIDSQTQQPFTLSYNTELAEQKGTIYYLKETGAPADYRQLQGYFELVISADGSVSVSYVGEDYPAGFSEAQTSVSLADSETATNTIAFTIKNQKKVPLPATGGSGIAMYLTLGIIGTLAAGIYFYRRGGGSDEKIS
ncbi:SpaA isopeptide-forming pilin-related protein [Enterococcus sp. LJL90]